MWVLTHLTRRPEAGDASLSSSWLSSALSGYESSLTVRTREQAASLT